MLPPKNGRKVCSMEDKKFPSRKHVRLKKYDYSLPGAYFVTICTKGRARVLSKIVGRCLGAAEGETLSPADELARVELSPIGDLAEKILLSMEERYENLKVDKYVIMPNHIHVIFVLTNTAGASPRPTIPDIVCAYKSLTVKESKSRAVGAFGFQTSFYEHVIRGHEDYDEHVKYISENPTKWHFDELFDE